MFNQAASIRDVVSLLSQRHKPDGRTQTSVLTWGYGGTSVLVFSVVTLQKCKTANHNRFSRSVNGCLFGAKRGFLLLHALFIPIHGNSTSAVLFYMANWYEIHIHACRTYKTDVRGDRMRRLPSKALVSSVKARRLAQGHIEGKVNQHLSSHQSTPCT